jgi:hypothetical protein
MEPAFYSFMHNLAVDKEKAVQIKLAKQPKKKTYKDGYIVGIYATTMILSW